MTTLTLDMLAEQVREMRRDLTPQPMLRTDKVVVTAGATKHDGYFFKPSRHRSKRIHKKLMKRFGCFERRKPAAFVLNGQVFMHPVLYSQLPRSSVRQREGWCGEWLPR